MITLHTLSETVAIEAGVIERWVALALVRPEVSSPGLYFREIDIARVRLLSELQSIGIDDEALPVVMSLLDQLYATRDQLRRVVGALEVLPVAIREDVISRLAL